MAVISRGVLQLGDVDYVHAKEINLDDPEYEFSDMFRQKVGFNASSIHIPVEIYEGGQLLPYKMITVLVRLLVKKIVIIVLHN